MIPLRFQNWKDSVPSSSVSRGRNKHFKLIKVWRKACLEVPLLVVSHRVQEMAMTEQWCYRCSSSECRCVRMSRLSSISSRSS